MIFLKLYCFSMVLVAIISLLCAVNTENEDSFDNESEVKKFLFIYPFIIQFFVYNWCEDEYINTAGKILAILVVSLFILPANLILIIFNGLMLLLKYIVKVFIKIFKNE